MRREAITTFSYGTLLLIGGIIGHLKAHSQASLIMGIVSATVVYVCTWALWQNKTWALKSSLVCTSVLMGFFAYRFILTEKFMPPGMLALVSLFVFISLFVQLKSTFRT